LKIIRASEISKPLKTYKKFHKPNLHTNVPAAGGRGGGKKPSSYEANVVRMIATLNQSHRTPTYTQIKQILYFSYD